MDVNGCVFHWHSREKAGRFSPLFGMFSLVRRFSDDPESAFSSTDRVSDLRPESLLADHNRGHVVRA